MVDEENLRYLKNFRLVFTAKSTSQITIEDVYIYDADVSDSWFKVTIEFLSDKKRHERVTQIAADYLEDRILNENAYYKED